MNLTDLEKLIPQYAANKNELDSYKKICEKENAKIKEIMKSFALEHFESGGYKVTYSISPRESIDEEMLLEIIRRNHIKGIIKTKEYIDFDALEKAMYDGNISMDVLLEMDKAKETKNVETLRISKIKVAKEEK